MNICEIFGSMVFNDSVMKTCLPPGTYAALRQTIDRGVALTPEDADTVACCLKDWAIGRGATHYVHWFQPMTGMTAGKYDSFISPAGNGKAVMDFSGKDLSKGEPDASSFPCGGLRATFEARGYTAWDPTSYAFVKDNTLHIPCAFYSYSGQILDQKTPLLRSMHAISKQSVRILRLFGEDIRRVVSNVGAEQEYFLIDKRVFDRRKDLIYTGRTLFGAMPPKGQEMDDHYFGTLKERVADYMRELDTELWKLGVFAKTKHNEAAPAQHELAPVFCTANLASDHNQLIMELMKKVAGRQGLVCLLHEKPFLGVSGSGKHNNWSLSTVQGKNLFEPGDSPQDNARFLLFLCAVIKAVNRYQDLLRLSASSAGNDHRLGTGEAPPAIVSIYLGDHLTAILDAIENDTRYTFNGNQEIELGVRVLPKFPRDTSDRNRTSPFAFTGNKFEFRMAGSNASISAPNIIINTIVADVLMGFADILEQAEDFNAALKNLIKTTIKENRRIIFNGDSYCGEWTQEAGRRGLSDLKNTPQAVQRFLDEQNIALFCRHKIFTKSEIAARTEIMLDSYIKTVRIEALTMLDMARRDIFPAAAAFSAEVSGWLNAKKATGLPLAGKAEADLLTRLSGLTDAFYENIAGLERAVDGCGDDCGMEAARYCAQTVLPAMAKLRRTADAIEAVTGGKYWPFPTYGEIMFSV